MSRIAVGKSSCKLRGQCLRLNDSHVRVSPLTARERPYPSFRGATGMGDLLLHDIARCCTNGLKNTKNVFVDVLLPAHFFARSFHGLCLKRAEQVDDERVFDHGHDLFFCLHMFHLWAKTKASSTMRVSGEAHECSLRNFL